MSSDTNPEPSAVEEKGSVFDALRKPGRHLSAYDEGWNDALDIAEQRLEQRLAERPIPEAQPMAEQVTRLLAVLHEVYTPEGVVIYLTNLADALTGGVPPHDRI